MKTRIKIDGLFLSSVIILLGVIYQFPQLYPKSRGLDDTMDFLAVLLILQGIFLRMTARGHKKEFSQQGKGLVSTGPYSIVRNPMYLGTYLIGCGFVLLLWPWWAVFVFSLAFYGRFRKQIMLEEDFLGKTFGENYRDYCRRVPRLFPTWESLWNMKTKEVFPWEQAWTTKEKRAIPPALLGIMILETFQQQVIFKHIDILSTLIVVALASAVFCLGWWYRYQRA